MDEYSNMDISRKLVSLLKEMVPQYHCESNAFINDGIYLLMNDFASTLSRNLAKNPNSSFVNQSFNFINTLGEENSMEVNNIVNVGVLEILYTEKSLNRSLVANRLSDKLRVQFNAWSRYYH